MLTMIAGQKVKFDDIHLAQTFTVKVDIRTDNIAVDVACFGLDAQQQLINDDYMTFYNQPVTPCGGVTLRQVSGQQCFNIDLHKLPDNVDYLVFTATIDGAQTMRDIGKSQVQIAQGATVYASYTFEGIDFKSEQAVMLMQVYRKNKVWRVNAIGQGFNGGLAALVNHFGSEVESATNKTTETIATKEIAHRPSVMQKSTQSDNNAPNAPNAPNKVNIKKVVLDKSGATHRMSLSKGGTENLIVEAIWIDNGDANANNDDLDLRVGILAQHSKEMTYIHAPMQPGSLTSPPYVQHQGDIQVASVGEPGKEVVLVNPDIAKHYGSKVALVFSVYSAVSNGAVSIASLQPKMRMTYKDQVVESVFNVKSSPKAKSSLVYTYVIGMAIIDEDGVTLQHSGETSKRMSESTPKLTWNGDNVDMQINGKPMFKPK